MSVLAALGGVLVLVVVWASVLRTVLIPRQTSSRMARWTARMAAAVGMAIARRLPRRACESVMDFCAPVSLLLMMIGWLLGLGLGFALLALAAGVAFDADAMIRFFEFKLAGTAGVLAVFAAVSVTVVIAVFLAHVVRFVDAYSRRERFVNRLAAQASRIPDGDRVLAEYLRSGSRDNLDSHFAEWADWLADVHGSHICYPGLVYHRPSGDLWWPHAAMIVMDAAALVDAVAPKWAPPHTRALLDSGTACLQQLAERIGVVVPELTVSLHGREECSFGDTVELATTAGLPAERDPYQAWAAFQDTRVRYAPYAVMIGTRLMWHGAPEEDEVEQSGLR
ncbi:hypothetical protein ALI144C_18035 [Actinosynnema sp. ALI-1.44]|uniref:hypothetical protein n=1 Tax=Actinosynnema sp. ALI-1.44 TaxID=1933779 RepID=UPI00097BB07D|nr:hypothetical protein [Actinosynnema sp. ALI-1.44]ONI82951.1 hypothetical protein ALI144C_18035 [Actinosynnema sp. ALI-1.44]